jgi:ribosome-binding factor A
MAAGMRRQRLGDQIKKAVSEIVHSKLKDPHLGMITITDVELTKDLRQAKVFYSVYGDTDTKRASNRALRKSAGFIQSELGRLIRVRKTPTLEFVIDHSMEHGLRIQELLEKIEREGQGDAGD